jgi:RNA recognition motif-containing protein
MKDVVVVFPHCFDWSGKFDCRILVSVNNSRKNSFLRSCFGNSIRISSIIIIIHTWLRTVFKGLKHFNKNCVDNSRSQATTTTSSFSQVHNMSANTPVSDAPPSKRIYLGNLPYQAQPQDMEQYLSDAGFEVVKLDMSVDPFSGQNPSYCFAELNSAEEAQRAISALTGGSFQGRLLRVNVHTPKRREGNDTGYTDRKPRILTYDQRGQASPSGVRTGANGRDGQPYASDRWARKDAESQWTAPVTEGKRLYVGGLPRIDGQEIVNEEMKGIFKDFQVEAISKIISPHESKKELPGNHYYCFVDFASVEDAKNAAAKFDNSESPWGGELKVRQAKESSASGRTPKVVREQLSDKPPVVRDFNNWRRG